MNTDPLHPLWPAVGRRIVDGLGVRPGELIQVRGDTSRFDVLQEILLAIELAGATPLPEIVPPALLERLWAGAAPETLAGWDRHRAGWLRHVDRVVTFHGGEAAAGSASPAAVAAWRRSVERLLAIEEERGLPILVVALPVARRADQLGLTLAELEAILLPALAVDAGLLRHEIDTALGPLDGVPSLTLHTAGRHELRLSRAGRPWLADDGVIDDGDRARGAVVSNLPAGSIYTTVLEDQTEGSLWLPAAGPARDVLLTFQAGRIVAIEAASGGTELGAWLDSHSGEPRRISHVGVGLNPALRRPIGWTLVDEHLPGCVFMALGENRYMGGHNISSLNVDFVVGPDALLSPAA